MTNPSPTGPADVSYTRRQGAERAVLPLATSIDGRSFSFQASLYDLEFRVGGYVVLRDGTSTWLGQVLTLDLGYVDAEEMNPDRDSSAPHRVTAALGTGTVLDTSRPFHDVVMEQAAPAQVAAWLESARPSSGGLVIGELADVPGVPATLDAGGFDRHTFLCGQSGSGKTYSLGVVLERLLIETELRIVVLDPNSDYVRLADVRAGADAEDAARYRLAARRVEVRRAESTGAEPLRVRVAELGADCRCALLQLDPVADREEYAAFTQLLELDEAGRPLIAGIDGLLTSDLPGARELGLRAANLGVLDWEIWERGAGGSLPQLLVDDAWRCLVVDLGSLDTPEEQSVVAESVLDTLWRHRRDRKPVLIVIDEAHNVCPQRPESLVVALATRHAIQIAAEGRKFGLHLLVSTQRPQKVHDNVLSQCDNLVLMRMNSASDLAHLAESFSFVPPSLLDAARHFGLGEALVAGKISLDPTLVRFGARISEEGGADVAPGAPSGS